MTMPDVDKLTIMYGHLVEQVDECTCPSGGDPQHYPECGYVPVASLVEVWQGLLRIGKILPADQPRQRKYDYTVRIRQPQPGVTIQTIVDLDTHETDLSFENEVRRG